MPKKHQFLQLSKSCFLFITVSRLRAGMWSKWKYKQQQRKSLAFSTFLNRRQQKDLLLQIKEKQLLESNRQHRIKPLQI
ncbi:hypothetical protein AXF42_Ash004422 [Apostasia shenzhenica]|uniref:Uncharacterized protein n=1 Tax=Apostasia shenzhenica TaxID=1088818 RepID=A0A2I0A2V6_9ASPA|nr:hypothetical protein AXF42_Ash004422 [Apostasia shenzhenica]